MRSELRVPLLALLASVALAGCKQDKASPRIQVLFTTDEHSHLFAVAPERDDFANMGTGALSGGIARRATVLEAERAAARARGVDTVTFSVGDFSQGTLASAAFLVTAPDLRAMKALGYDAATLGNHEFDLGPAALAYSIGIAQAHDALPPLVLTNVVFSGPSAADDALAAMYGEGAPVAPWRLVTTRGGLKVGVVGVLGPSAAKVAGGAPPVQFWDPAVSDPYAAIALKVQPVVDALRRDHHADFVVVLSHGGIGPTAAAPGDDEKLAVLLHGVDVVLSGHSHRTPDAPRMVANVDGREIAVVQPAPYGREVGRVELVLEDGRARVDPARTAFLPVTGATAPTTDAKVLDELIGVVAALEDGTPFLSATLAGIEGAPVPHATPGDLYFRTLGHTTFDVIGLAPGETDGMNLDTDAMLATARTLVTTAPTVAALQASGAIRGDLLAGATGDLSFADLYRVVPLGVDPTDGTPGYPLVRAYLSTVELKDALELSLLQSMLDGDFFIGVSGLRVEYDKTRPPFDPYGADPTAPGWIVRLARVDAAGAELEVLYDATLPAAQRWGTTAATLQPIVTTWQIGAFASAFGATLRDAAGVPIPSLAAAALGPAGRHVKDHQALASYVYALCAGGTAALPSVYDAATAEGAVPRRMVCSGAICP